MMYSKRPCAWQFAKHVRKSTLPNMQQASRTVAIILFLLMQFFAPLVHAHAGGGQLSGSIHVPGLEFLEKASGTSAKAINHDTSSGVIVGVATGLRIQGDESDSLQDVAFDFPPSPLSDKAFPSVLGRPYPILQVDLPRTFWLFSTPRAPPQYC